MRRRRRSVSIAVALYLLVGSAAVGGAAAAGDSPGGPSGQQAGADQGPHRKKAVEPKGRPASAGDMAAGRLSCGQVITRSTTLTRDVGPCPADGVIIGADNIQLNLNGHTISGTPGVGDGNAAGIRLPFKTGVTITGHPGDSGKTGTVTGFDGGVLLNGGSGNTIENLAVKDNIGPGGDATLSDGIVLFHSAKNRIVNNVVSHNGPFDGIGVLGVDSSGNLLRGNTVEDTPASETEFDFVFDGSGVGILINNFLDEEGTPRRGEPIHNNDVIDNVVRRNDNSGISNITNVGARIAGNTVRDNGQAGEVCVDGRGGRTCLPVAGPSNGIGFTAGPITTRLTRALIEGNTVTGNTGNGIHISTRQNRITGNTAVRNGGSEAGKRGFGGRFDLLDDNSTEVLCEPGSGVTCPPAQPSCDQNVWHQNVFETAFPECAEETGPNPVPPPPPDPSCSDGIDNDGDGFIDEDDANCGGEGRPDLGGLGSPGGGLGSP